MYKNILVPTDGSESSGRTILAAVDLARAVGAKITGLYVTPSATPLIFKGILPVGYVTPEEHETMIAEAAARNLEVIEKAAQSAGVSCECLTITGDFPAEAIVKIATKQGCDLIFMAPHGHRNVSTLILGSETQKVLGHSTIPVLVHR